MWTDTMQIQVYKLTSGRNEIQLPAGAEIKETTWGGILTLEPRNTIHLTKRFFWVIGCNVRIEESLYTQLKYVGAWWNGEASLRPQLMTVWEEIPSTEATSEAKK